jgi:3-hydroxymyristoyl/3-hydroxydecanoyl-(acyl carrier protein) dehydratase
MKFNEFNSTNARFPKRKLLRLLGAAAFTIATGVAMTEANAQVMGWLELKPGSGRNVVQITGHALALEKAAGLEFTISVMRENHGNKTNSRQAGRIGLAAGETKVLSSTSINVEPGDNLRIELKILDNGQEVFGTVMSAKPSVGGQTL